jgi:hypothetical protein
MMKRLVPLKPTLSPEHQKEWLRVFFHRARGYADAVKMGRIGFVDAVEILAGAAIDSGLADVIDDSRLQKTIAWAFGVWSPAPMQSDVAEQTEPKPNGSPESIDSAALRASKQ